MKVDTNLSITYNHLIDTLIMVCPAFESISDNEIVDYIEELEGDYYTFFDYNSLIPLIKANLLDHIQVDKIVKLKNNINDISPDLWNKVSFQIDLKWNTVREQANDILNSLHVSRRKLE